MDILLYKDGASGQTGNSKEYVLDLDDINVPLISNPYSGTGTIRVLKFQPGSHDLGLNLAEDTGSLQNFQYVLNHIDSVREVDNRGYIRSESQDAIQNDRIISYTVALRTQGFHIEDLKRAQLIVFRPAISKEVKLYVIYVSTEQRVYSIYRKETFARDKPRTIAIINHAETLRFKDTFVPPRD